MAKQEKTFEDYTKGTPFEGRTEAQVKNALYTQALQDLRNEHTEEFVGLVEKAYAAYGLSYKRRLTEAEKAEQQINALLAAHPDLASKFQASVETTEDLEDIDPQVADDVAEADATV